MIPRHTSGVSNINSKEDQVERKHNMLYSDIEVQLLPVLQDLKKLLQYLFVQQSFILFFCIGMIAGPRGANGS